jgi:hypothetical protein
MAAVWEGRTKRASLRIALALSCQGSAVTRMEAKLSDVLEIFMRVFWERIGILGPVFRMGSQGLSDREIANRLNITEVKVHDCVAWILHFLQLTDRMELARYASFRPTI